MPSPVFEFDQFELDVSAYELRHAGRKIPLQRVPMDLLILLLERRGALVSREEIVARVWKDDGMIDPQASINTAIRKVRQALDDVGEQPRFVETVVGKGYRFIGEVAARMPAQSAPVAAPLQAQTPTAAAKRRHALPALAAVAGVVFIGAAGLLLSRRAPQSRQPMTVVPFTALAGAQSWPAFSPGGRRIAFGWTGDAGTCSHIYIKTVGSAWPVKMTDSGECDSSPSWSRDGRWIAFLRGQPGGSLGVYIMPSAGGIPRKIATVNGPRGYRPAWTPDGMGLVVMDSDPPDAPPSLFRVAVDSGEKRRMTTAESGGTGDWCPAYSPDGRTLGYLHDTGSWRLAPLYIVGVDSHGMPSALPRMVQTAPVGFTDFDWSADGRSLIAAAPYGLVRVPLSGGSVVPLPFPDASQLTVAPRGNEMVYVQPSRDTDIFRLPGPRGSGGDTRLISSTRQESAPQYSADGRNVVFVSDRTGSEEIWTAGSTGENARQVTSFGGPAVGSPRPSPDGKCIAFDSTAGGKPAIYLIAARGGSAQRITSEEVSSVRPSWSHDGQWIYFGSDASGDWQIWKVRPQGGKPIQVTQKGGREAFEDPSGKFVDYTKMPPEKGIWRVPSSGGDEIKISDSGSQGRWAMGGRGIYYLRAADDLVFQEFASKRCVHVPTPGLEIGEGLANMIAAAPGDRWILLTAQVHSEVHMALVRNFR